jgi:hypothetical protein
LILNAEGKLSCIKIEKENVKTIIMNGIDQSAQMGDKL